ncbi:hypothetical protein PhCBS80983_g05893 [Powellomyces hirtus]|uniref:MICOS complex subunit MIC10 n=1 Tax=Powellomyces hirtus TaxID=109895 RepID=A0A507DRX8_9FUNG|nr:hypothetical protein PhCBS80983_g05893 [Powellomyces hirtus]
MSTIRDSVIPSEEILARKYDRALANAAIKAGLGVSVGVGLSFIFFRRKMWPIALSTGFGLGIAYEQCARSFNPYRQIGEEIKPISAIPRKP